MQIDAFTLIAQIVNFIILLVLLRIFLYQPIIDAMNEREEKIASRLHEAEEKRQTADEERDTYRQKREQIENERQEILSKARQDANEKRQQLLERAQEEVDDKKAQWYRALNHEKENFLRGLQSRVESQLLTVIEQALDKLADAELEQQMLHRFNQMIIDRDADVKEALDRSDTQLTIYSTIALPDDQKQNIRDTLIEHIEHDVEMTFERDADLICGIVLQTGDYRIGWNIQQYLTTLENHMRELLDEELPDADDDNAEEQETEMAHG